MGFKVVESLKYKNNSVQIPISKGVGSANLIDSEPWMFQVLELCGEHSLNFLDVGANIGQTLLKWRFLFLEKTYTGIEPNTICVNYLHELIALNQIKNCRIIPFALDEQKGERMLQVSQNDSSDTGATMIENYRNNSNVELQKIKTIPLSEVENNQFDLVKIDVEGAELEVLKTIFSNHIKPTIICEILPVYKAENTSRLKRQQAIESLLGEQNYHLFRIKKGANLKFDKLSTIGIHSDLEFCDYLFVPDSNQSLLAKINSLNS